MRFDAVRDVHGFRNGSRGGPVMRTAHVTLPEIALVGGTRVLLGFGLGLLASGGWSDERRRSVGWALALVGLVTTIPLAAEILGHLDRSVEEMAYVG